MSDIMLMHHLRFPDLSHDLGFIGSMFSNKPQWKENKKDFKLYNARDVDVTLQAYRQLKPMLQHSDLLNLYELVQVPLAKICKLMSDTGFKINPNRIEEVREKITNEILAEEKYLPEDLRTRTILVGRRSDAPAGTVGKSGKPVKYITTQVEETERPWASSAQVAKYLYETLGLEPVRDLKTDKITTGKMAIAKLYNRTKNPAIKAIGSLRKKASILNLFAKEEMLKIGVVKTHFNVHGTACLSPETLVCTSDLNWKSIGETEVGETLIGFDEEGLFRKLRPSIIEEKKDLVLPSYRITTSKGTIYASADHGWLVNKGKQKSAKGCYQWQPSSALKPGDVLAYWKDPWFAGDTFTDGYIAGFFDGEGCVHKKTGGLHFSQNEGSTLEEIKDKLSSLGYAYHQTPSDKKLKHVHVHDGIRVVGSTRPQRLLKRSDSFWLNKLAYGKPVEVLEVEFLGNRPNVGIRTSTRTFIANGFLSHNSGRLSSSDPNLQNITEAARHLYVPRHEGWSIIDVDYSGIENRLTAYFANDQERLDRFTSIPDYSEHKHAASIFFGIPYDEVEKDNDKDAPYGKAKRIVHGSNYGMGAKKISMMYDMDFNETKRLLEAWKKELGKTVQWQNRLADQAKKDGFLTTPFGRKRWFYTTSYYTESLSFLPQSAAADVIFRAMLGLMYERINWPLELVSKVVGYVEPLPKPAQLLIQVHDSLVFESPNEMIPQVVGTIKRVMEQPWRELGGLILPIGISVGPSWGEAKKYGGPVL